MRVLAILAMLLLLAACGSGNREIQSDGTGSDEMRRSPCACEPVRYDPPGFGWRPA